MFFRQMTDAFLVATDPASSIVKPAHVHMTSAPQMRNEKVFRTNCISPSTAVRAADGASAATAAIAVAVNAAASVLHLPRSERAVDRQAAARIGAVFKGF